MRFGTIFIVYAYDSGPETGPFCSDPNERKYLAEKEKYGDHDQIAKCITLMERGTFSEDLNPPPGLGNDKVVDGFFSAELNNE